MATTPRKRHLSPQAHRALELLAGNSRGLTEAFLSESGFNTKMLACLDHQGLVTAMIAERVKNGGKVIEVVRIKITDTGRKVLGKK
jgi:hypothetical protein